MERFFWQLKTLREFKLDVTKKKRAEKLLSLEY